MPKTVDARGLGCPRPVLLTRAALVESPVVLTIVDNEISKNNVCRMAESKGHAVEVEEKKGDFHVTITAGDARAEPGPAAQAASTGEAGPLVVVLGADEMGRGEPDLGKLLLRTFLQTLAELDPVPDTVICFNTGVKLTVEGAVTVESLQALANLGVQVLVCGTCLDYFQAKGAVAVGEVSNMFTIVETLAAAGKIVNM